MRLLNKSGDVRKGPKRFLFLLVCLSMFFTAIAAVTNTAGKPPVRHFFTTADTGHNAPKYHNGRR